MNERCAKLWVRLKNSEVQSRESYMCWWVWTSHWQPRQRYHSGRADVTPCVWCTSALLPTFQRRRGKTKMFSAVRMLAELCSILSHVGQSQFKQIFIFFSCSISTKCLFSSDKASLSQTLLLSCTGIITENCTVCSIFANWANAKLCKLFTKKEQNQTSKWVCASH